MTSRPVSPPRSPALCATGTDGLHGNFPFASAHDTHSRLRPRKPVDYRHDAMSSRNASPTPMASARDRKRVHSSDDDTYASYPRDATPSPTRRSASPANSDSDFDPSTAAEPAYSRQAHSQQLAPNSPLAAALQSPRAQRHTPHAQRQDDVTITVARGDGVVFIKIPENILTHDDFKVFDAEVKTRATDHNLSPEEYANFVSDAKLARRRAKNRDSARVCSKHKAERYGHLREQVTSLQAGLAAKTNECAQLTAALESERRQREFFQGQYTALLARTQPPEVGAAQHQFMAQPAAHHSASVAPPPPMPSMTSSLRHTADAAELADDEAHMLNDIDGFLDWLNGPLGPQHLFQS